MAETELTKVYELAKEMGMDSISLLDRLSALGIKAKSHMSELSAEDVARAKEALAAPKKAATASRVRKKTTETDASSRPSSVTLASKPKAVTRTPSPSAPSASPSASAAGAKLAKERTAAKTAASDTIDSGAAAASRVAPVIRRRIKTDGEATEVLIGAPTSAATTTGDDGESVVAAGGSPYGSFAPAPDAEPSSETVEAETGQIEAVQASAEVALVVDTTLEGAVLDPPGAVAGPEAGAPTESKRAPVAPFLRPVAPRKSFLKIVELPKPPVRPAQAPGTGDKNKSPVMRGTTTQQDKDGFRIIKMTKENLDQMAEEEAAKKRGGGREAEIRPEDVRFADYRKKEMIFLPKKKRLPVGKELKQTKITTPKATKRVVEMGNQITVADFASQLGVKGADVIRKLMGMGQMATLNQSIDFDTATLIATEYQHEVRNIAFQESSVLERETDKDEDLVARPPVVTIMGHVDHGKTSLLDRIRETNVAAGEAGGITQHIGAYTITKDGKLITFIDTPGHEAFTVMRARGAAVTDIVILVVAADDGVMPQTREALSHAQAAGVPIIVAVNKMDKPGAQPDRVRQQLAELNLLSEDWGGQTMFVPVSALKGDGIPKLLESILLQAEVMELKSNAQARAEGVVLEARLEKGRGPVVSVLVKRGTLNVGDPIVAGVYPGRVRAMTDARGEPQKVASPGFAVEILGLEGVPSAGDRLDGVASESDARTVADHRSKVQRAQVPGAQGKVSLEDLFAKIQAGSLKELNIVLKADVYGSVEAVRDSLIKLSNDQIKVKVIHSATGGITESDVLLATASHALIIGFNVRPEGKARQTAEAEHVEVKTYSIIYELIDDVKKAMVGLLDKKKVEKYLGRAEVRQIFSVPKIGVIAGCSVIDGKILRAAGVRLLRDSKIVFEGKLGSLKRFKDDAKEVAQGFECGIGLENYNDLKPGDVIEAFEIEWITPELAPAQAGAGATPPSQAGSFGSSRAGGSPAQTTL